MNPKTLFRLVAVSCVAVLSFVSCKKKAQDDSPSTTSTSSSTVGRISSVRDSMKPSAFSGLFPITVVYKFYYNPDSTMKSVNVCETIYGSSTQTGCKMITYTYSAGMIIKSDSGYGTMDTLRLDNQGRLTKFDTINFDYYPGTNHLWHGSRYPATTYSWGTDNLMTKTDANETVSYEYYTNMKAIPGDMFQLLNCIDYGRTVIANKNLLKSVTSNHFSKSQIQYTMDNSGKIAQMLSITTSLGGSDTVKHFYSFEY